MTVDLAPFCSPGDPVVAFRRPFSSLGHTWATNRYVIVRIEGYRPEIGASWRDVPRRMWEILVELIGKCDRPDHWQAFEWPPLFTPCGKCDDAFCVLQPCDDPDEPCPGAACPFCGGSGSYPVQCPDCVAYVLRRSFAPRWLRLLDQLSSGRAQVTLGDDPRAPKDPPLLWRWPGGVAVLAPYGRAGGDQ